MLRLPMIFQPTKHLSDVFGKKLLPSVLSLVSLTGEGMIHLTWEVVRDRHPILHIPLLGKGEPVTCPLGDLPLPGSLHSPGMRQLATSPTLPKCRSQSLAAARAGG